DRHGAGVHRAAAVHERWPEQCDAHAAAPDLPLRLPEQPRRRVRDGRGAEPDARGLPGAVHGDLLPPDPRLEHQLVIGLARRRPARSEVVERGIVSAGERRDRRTRWTLRAVQAATLVFLLVVGLGPILWMLKASVTPTQDTLRTPMALWPNGID